MMEEILHDFIDLTNATEVQVDQHTGYYYQGALFFALSSLGNDRIYYELEDAAEYLSKSGVEGIVAPIRVKDNQYSIAGRNGTYVICKAIPPTRKTLPFSAQQLASFHHIGASYPYQPTTFSSYGSWKTLWTNQVDRFEMDITEIFQERPVSEWQRIWIDVSAYVIGLGENAIQYLQESELETRHQDSDQATFTLERYPKQAQTLLWFDQLRHDHPARDIAEAIRPMLLKESGPEEMLSFLQAYQAQYPLSIFGIRLLYARLLFPVHLFDQFRLVRAQANNGGLVRDTRELFDNQKRYELQLRRFYDLMQVSAREWELPVLDW
jgi:spore coat protein YutH